MEEWWNEICMVYGVMWNIVKITIPMILALLFISIYLSNKLKKSSTVRELTDSEIQDCSCRILDKLDVSSTDEIRYKKFLNTVMKQGLMKLTIENVSSSPLQDIEEANKEIGELQERSNKYFLMKCKTIFFKEYWKYHRYV